MPENSPIDSLWELHQFLTSQKIPYAVIGGIAVQYWGEPRFTRDIDATVLITPGKEEEAVKILLSKFSSRISDALGFALKNRVLLLRASNGHEIDISFGLPGYEEMMISRAVDFDLGNDRRIRIASAEDLIIHKAVAGRALDLADLESIILRQGRKLDDGYIRRWLKEFVGLMETEEPLRRFQDLWTQLSK